MLNLVAKAVPQPRSIGAATHPLVDESTLAALLSISKITRAIYGIKLAAIGFHNGQDELLLAIDPVGVPVSMLAEQLMVRPLDGLEDAGSADGEEAGRACCR